MKDAIYPQKTQYVIMYILSIECNDCRNIYVLEIFMSERAEGEIGIRNRYPSYAKV